jgi:hypothetical protein
MKIFTILGSVLLLAAQSVAFAADHPDGEIVFRNASSNQITAQVSTFGKFNIAANEQKNVSYGTLSQVCSANPTNCKANFYINNTHAGTATINTVTGKVVDMNLAMKVRIAKGDQQVVRSVTLK